MHSASLFPLTPALSPREREVIGSARNGSRFSEHYPPVESDSLSFGERVRVRGNSVAVTI